MTRGTDPLARYRPERLSLIPGSPAGGAMDKAEVLLLKHELKQPVLRFRSHLSKDICP